MNNIPLPLPLPLISDLNDLIIILKDLQNNCNNTFEELIKSLNSRKQVSITDLYIKKINIIKNNISNIKFISNTFFKNNINSDRSNKELNLDEFIKLYAVMSVLFSSDLQDQILAV